MMRDIGRVIVVEGIAYNGEVARIVLSESVAMSLRQALNSMFENPDLREARSDTIGVRKDVVR
jgi:hypothetical protein